MVGHLGQELTQGVEPLLPQLVGRPEHRAGAAVDQPAFAEPAAHGLAADLDVVDLAQQDGDGLAAPAAPQEAEVAWSLLGDPVEGEFDPGGIEAGASAGPVPGDRLDALGVESLDPSVDRATAAIQERGDGDPGLTIAQE